MTNIPAVFGLNRYLWSKLDGTVLDKANYSGLVPIIPVQEVPAFLQAMDKVDGIASYPYIVYTWYSNGYDQQWFVPNDRIIYTIYSRDNAKLRDIILLMTKHFKRHDESARAVNNFIRESTLSAAYKEYDYKFITVEASQAGSHTSDENAPVRAMVTVKVAYSHTEDDQPL